MKHQRAETPALLDGIEASRRFFASSFSVHTNRERLLVAHVDEKARCIGTSEHDGSVDAVDLPVRAILGDALRLGSAGLVIAHNHPGGRAEPSRSDCLATRRLSDACRSLDIALVDHLIFGGSDVASMRRLGYL